jgi:GTP-binding protein
VDSLLVAARRSTGAESANSLNRLMDSGELEIERGITITSKVTRFGYKDQIINCVDTPGHADFCGEVDRILSK